MTELTKIIIQACKSSGNQDAVTTLKKAIAQYSDSDEDTIRMGLLYESLTNVLTEIATPKQMNEFIKNLFFTQTEIEPEHVIRSMIGVVRNFAKRQYS